MFLFKKDYVLIIKYCKCITLGRVEEGQSTDTLGGILSLTEPFLANIDSSVRVEPSSTKRTAMQLQNDKSN